MYLKNELHFRRVPKFWFMMWTIRFDQEMREHIKDFVRFNEGLISTYGFGKVLRKKYFCIEMKDESIVAWNASRRHIF